MVSGSDRIRHTRDLHSHACSKGSRRTRASLREWGAGGLGHAPISTGPGSNATGVSRLTCAPEAKRLGLLREVVPNTEVSAAPFHTNRQWKASTR